MTGPTAASGVSPTTVTVVVIGANQWDAGPTVAEAKKRFTREGGRLGLGYAVLTFPPGTTFHGVDEVGRYHYRGDPPAIRHIAPTPKSEWT